MDFELTEDQKVLRDSVREVVENEIRPKAIDTDKNHAIEESVIATIKELGFLGIYLPEKYSGAGLDYLSYILVVEEVSKACGSTGTFISAHTSLCCDPILNFGNEEQKQKYLPPLAKGEKIGCFLLSEPEAGSDVASMTTTYTDEGDHFVVTGGKIFVTNGGFRDTGVLFATKDKSLKHKGMSAFVIDLKSEGVELLKNEDKLGIRGTSTSAFALDKVKIPKENLLGEEGQGFKIAMATLNGGRIGIAALAIGLAGGAFELARTYSQERVQFGKPISALQAIRFKLAEMAMRIETAQLVTYKAAWFKDNKKANPMASAMAKAIAAEAATYVTKEAIQIHGGNGYTCEYQVERMFRDAKITEIFEGTDEVQRVVISKMLLG
jgi:butyryl-CoA dehydrogenase